MIVCEGFRWGLKIRILMSASSRTLETLLLDTLERGWNDWELSWLFPCSRSAFLYALLCIRASCKFSWSFDFQRFNIAWFPIIQCSFCQSPLGSYLFVSSLKRRRRLNATLFGPDMAHARGDQSIYCISTAGSLKRIQAKSSRPLLLRKWSIARESLSSPSVVLLRHMGAWSSRSISC